MLIAERRELFGSDGHLWAGENEVRKIKLRVECWNPDQAEALFLGQAMLLGFDVSE